MPQLQGRRYDKNFGGVKPMGVGIICPCPHWNMVDVSDKKLVGTSSRIPLYVPVALCYCNGQLSHFA